MMGRYRKIVFPVLLGFLSITVFMAQRAIDSHRQIIFEDHSPQFLPNGKALAWMSLGHRETMADILWIRSILYYGRRVADPDNPYFAYQQHASNIDLHKLSHAEVTTDIPKKIFLPDTVPGMNKDLLPVLYRMQGRGLVDYIYPLLDRVTTLDPHFITPYMFGGVSVLMDTGRLDKAEALLAKGRKLNPDEWRFPFYQGWLTWMYRGNALKAQTLMLEAAALSDCPGFVMDLIAGLAGKLNRVELTRRYLMGLWGSTESAEIRKQLEELIKRLD